LPGRWEYSHLSPGGWVAPEIAIFPSPGGWVVWEMAIFLSPGGWVAREMKSNETPKGLVANIVLKVMLTFKYYCRL